MVGVTVGREVAVSESPGAVVGVDVFGAGITCVGDGLIVREGTGEGKAVARPPHAVSIASRRTAKKWAGRVRWLGMVGSCEMR